MKLDILYRGPLSSCNYACGYCPFAKRSETHEQLLRDRLALDRFESWLKEQHEHSFAVLFTPWGEALIRSWYRETIARLTFLEHIRYVSVQTNLSAPLRWLRECNIEKLSLWASYHPDEVSRPRFLSQIEEVISHGAGISVGIVATPRALTEIPRLRAELPGNIYMWINAQRPPVRPYTTAEIDMLTAIDPYFPTTRLRHRTRGLECRTGETSFTVDGDGVMRRCHFVAEPIGKIYDANWLDSIQPRVCPRATCECYIGLVNVEALPLRSQFSDQWLARRPIKLLHR